MLIIIGSNTCYNINQKKLLIMELEMKLEIDNITLNLDGMIEF